MGDLFKNVCKPNTLVSTNLFCTKIAFSKTTTIGALYTGFYTIPFEISTVELSLSSAEDSSVDGSRTDKFGYDTLFLVEL